MSLNSALDALFILDLGRRRRAELVAFFFTDFKIRAGLVEEVVARLH